MLPLALENKIDLPMTIAVVGTHIDDFINFKYDILKTMGKGVSSNGRSYFTDADTNDKYIFVTHICYARCKTFNGFIMLRPYKNISSALYEFLMQRVQLNINTRGII